MTFILFFRNSTCFRQTRTFTFGSASAANYVLIKKKECIGEHEWIYGRIRGMDEFLADLRCVGKFIEYRIV